MTTATIALQPTTARRLRNWARPHSALLALTAVLLVLCIVTASRSDVFLTVDNLRNVFLQVSVLSIAAAGTTMLMVAGGIDLSIGAAMSLVAVSAATFMQSGMGLLPALALAALIGMGIGAVNGSLAAYSTNHPFIITLGMAIILQGLAIAVTGGSPISSIDRALVDFGAGRLLGIPMPVWTAAMVLVAVAITLRFTVFGRRLYALGGSEQATRLAGVRVRRLKVLLYTANGLIVAVASIVLMSRIASAQPLMGNGYELQAIAAVAVGGTPLAGGRGGIVGTILGVLLLGVISNSLNLLGVSGAYQYVFQGLVIVVAVMSQRSR
jgi:ribose/xylose/arabinose/galactoside ABC-type transport system permease subunit